MFKTSQIVLYILLEIKVSLVSDEAFRLDASLAVNVIISALRVLTHPDDKLEESKLVKLYQQQVLKTKKTSNELFIDITI